MKISSGRLTVQVTIHHWVLQKVASFVSELPEWPVWSLQPSTRLPQWDLSPTIMGCAGYTGKQVNHCHLPWSSLVALLQVMISLKCDEPRKCNAQLKSVMLSTDQTRYHSMVHFSFWATQLLAWIQHTSPPVHELHVQVGMWDEERQLGPRFQVMHDLVMVLLPFIPLPVVSIGLLSNYIVAVKECLGSWLYFSLIL